MSMNYFIQHVFDNYHSSRRLHNCKHFSMASPKLKSGSLFFTTKTRLKHRLEMS